MQDPYLAPDKCARLLPGPNPALLFLPKSVSSSPCQGNPQQPGHGISRAPRSMKRGFRCIPVGGWSSEYSPLSVKASVLGLSRHFWFPRLGGQGQWCWWLRAGQVGWQDSPNHPSSRRSAPNPGRTAEEPQPHCPERKRMDRDNDHSFATHNSGWREIKHLSPALQKAVKEHLE